MTPQQFLASTLTSTDVPPLTPDNLRRWQNLRFVHPINFHNVRLDVPRYLVLDRVPWFKTLRHIISDLTDLRAEEDSDGYIFRPSDYAFNHVTSLLYGTYRNDTELADQLPKPFVSPDGRGGIRVEWSLGQRVVSLLRPGTANRQPYIYYATGEEHGANQQVSIDSLTMSLRWLLDRG